jgi:hypothetical protein
MGIVCDCQLDTDSNVEFSEAILDPKTKRRYTFIVRHGERSDSVPEYSHLCKVKEDPPLTPRGRK